MGGCSVASCKNRFIRGKKHFFRFPKDWRRDLWAKFTLRGEHFIPKASSTICEDHFSNECIQKKKDRVCLSKDAVPKIMVYDTVSYEIRYDEEKRKYIEEDFLTHKPSAKVDVPDTEESIIEERQCRIDNLKTMCRYCVTSEAVNLSISKLDEYSISIEEVTNILAIDPQVNQFLSEFICELCFESIVKFHSFRKKVKETHLEVLSEIQEIDERLANCRNSANFEIISYDPTTEFLEEALIDEEFVDSGEIEYIEEEFSDIINSEDQSTILEEIGVGEGEDGSIQAGVDEYEMVTTDDIIKNPERNRFCFKIYECFFCKMVSWKELIYLIKIDLNGLVLLRKSHERFLKNSLIFFSEICWSKNLHSPQMSR